MILIKPTPWGEITGKLSLTPEQAKRMFNFNMRPDARGVVLFKMGGKQIIRNLVRCTTKTNKKIKRIQRIFRILAKIANAHLDDLIYPVWMKSAKNRNCLPSNIFIGMNIKKICRIKRRGRRKWKHLIITQGEIPAPKIYTRFYHRNKKLSVYLQKVEQCKIGIAVLDTYNFKLYHFKDCDNQTNEDKNWVRIQIEVPEIVSPIVFAYFRKEDRFSNSTSIIPPYAEKAEEEIAQFTPYKKGKKWLPEAKYHG
ncbi:MAG: hypothetical protein QMD71_05735 [bacterium]|nr:hypothetical protein [bacterium]